MQRVRPCWAFRASATAAEAQRESLEEAEAGTAAAASPRHARHEDSNEEEIREAANAAVRRAAYYASIAEQAASVAIAAMQNMRAARAMPPPSSVLGRAAAGGADEVNDQDVADFNAYLAAADRAGRASSAPASEPRTWNQI